MEPIKGGALAKVPAEVEILFKEKHPELSVPSWAIRFAASHEGIKVVLSGMSNLDQVNDNTSYMEQFKPLDLQETDIFNQAVGLINATITVPCTACDYCTKGCPMNIPIPKYFALLNAEKQSDPRNFSIQKVYYNNILHNNFAKASACIECLQCEGECPQHIEITKFLKDVVTAFE